MGYEYSMFGNMKKVRINNETSISNVSFDHVLENCMKNYLIGHGVNEKFNSLEVILSELIKEQVQSTCWSTRESPCSDSE